MNNSIINSKGHTTNIDGFTNSGRTVSYESRSSSIDSVGEWSGCFNRFRGSEDFIARFDNAYKRFCKKHQMSCKGLEDAVNNGKAKKYARPAKRPADVQEAPFIKQHPDEVNHDFLEDYIPASVHGFDAEFDQLAA